MTVIPSERIVLARHPTPGGEIQLQRRSLPDGTLAYEIISGGVFLMASYNQVSERALARRGLETLGTTPRAERRVLVGGLGMGFTLQEILSREAAYVDVVEISPYVIEWNGTFLAGLNGDVLADPRVRLIRDDLYNVLRISPPATYQAILLDVDNGPSWLAHEDNARLYTREALERWAALLTPGGSLAVWSAQPEPEFLERAQAVFGRAEEIPILAPDYRNQPVEHFVYRAARD
jgi:spermidine synthase